MIFKISSYQFSYLTEQLKKVGSDLFNHLKSSNEKGTFTFIDLNEDIAIEIRDWASKKLQKCGFDEDYKLTKEGEILEDLIDALYS